MIRIPEDFFKEELREGYLISEIMKRSWASQLTLLERLKALLDKYDLQYYAECGTLLGAIRHKGYIPWDDDLDIAMPRKDFMTLIEHADEIGDDLVIRSAYNSETYMNCHAVITHKADILKWDEKRYEDYHKCPFICYVDIFPYDYQPGDPKKFKIHRQLYCFAYKLSHDCRDLENALFGGEAVSLRQMKAQKEAEGLLEDVEKLKVYLKQHAGISASFDEGKPLRQQLFLYADKVAGRWDEKDGELIDYSPNLAYSETGHPRNSDWVKELIEVPFEFTTIKAPKDYHEVLRHHYGDAYMTPVRGASDHGFPFFRDEVRVLMGGDLGDDFIYYGGEVSDADIPGEWKKIFINEDGSLKRIVLYGLSGTDVLNGGSVSLSGIRDFIRQQEQRGDTVVIALAPRGLSDFMKKCELEMYSDYQKLIEDIREMGGVIFATDIRSRALQALMMLCDEYYGDECRLSQLCRDFGVPVTIQKYQ